jgi:hypothetical protein
MATPTGALYRCINGHIFCQTCKGFGSFGPSCRECHLVEKKKRKIRPVPLTPETESSLCEAREYIRRCLQCKRKYYDLLDYENHESVCSDCMIKTEWDNLDPELGH